MKESECAAWAHTPSQGEGADRYIHGERKKCRGEEEARYRWSWKGEDKRIQTDECCRRRRG